MKGMTPEEIAQAFAHRRSDENPWTALVGMWRQMAAGGCTWPERVGLFVAIMADHRQQQRERGEVA